MPDARTPAAERPSAVHSYNVRICHWINLVSCVYLLWSGVHIFLDFPELYWGNTGYRGYPAVFRLEDWGLSWEEAGALGDRRWGRNYHFTVAWVFLINGLVYVVWNLYSTHFRNRMLPARDEWTVAHVRAAARSFPLAIAQARPRRQLRHAAEDVVFPAHLRICAVHDPHWDRTVTRLHGRDARAAGSVRGSSVGADASHHRNRVARTVCRRSRAGGRGGGIRQQGPVDDYGKVGARKR
jgi:Prokaryotic cytochrome b561